MCLRPLGLPCPRTPALSSCQPLTFGSLSRRVSILPVCVHTHSAVFVHYVSETKTIKSFQNQQAENTGEFRMVIQSSFLLVLQCDTVIIIIIILGVRTRFHSNNILKDEIQNDIYIFSSTQVATICFQTSIIHSFYSDMSSIDTRPTNPNISTGRQSSISPVGPLIDTANSPKWLQPIVQVNPVLDEYKPNVRLNKEANLRRRFSLTVRLQFQSRVVAESSSFAGLFSDQREQ